MKQSEIFLINSLQERFSQIESEISEISNKSLKTLLKGYEILGRGSFTTAFYNPKLEREWKKKKDKNLADRPQIILLTQDFTKIFLYELHKKFPNQEHFPALTLLGKVNTVPVHEEGFLKEQPIHKRMYPQKPIVVFSMPMYSAVLFNASKGKRHKLDRWKWATVPMQNVNKIKTKDITPIEYLSLTEQLDYLMKFIEKVEEREQALQTIDVDIMDELPTNMNTYMLSKALKELIKERIK